MSSCVKARNVDEMRFRTVLLIAFKVVKGAAMLEVIVHIIVTGTWKPKNQNQGLGPLETQMDFYEQLWASILMKTLDSSARQLF